MKVFVLTDSPSPYQVELFNEIARQDECVLKIGYLRSRDPLRQWTPPELRHESIDMDRRIGEARYAARESDLVVFNYYFHRQAMELMGERASYGGPWCFWGERPGFRQPAWAGRLLRRWKLARLHGSCVPIWGIGKFAVDEYRREFGPRRSYFNLPYFSDLQRFESATGEGDKQGAERVFLFCGSLIPRKGVDLLARAFVHLAAEAPEVRLRIAGAGELRQSLVDVLRPVRERVEFTGFKNWDELPELYASADVLCVPSRYDGWGLVVPEGLASGLPVIATDRMGAALEFVQTGVNGWLIPAGDEMAILQAMREAVQLDRAGLERLSRDARESVKEHTLAQGAARFVQFAEQAVHV